MGREMSESRCLVGLAIRVGWTSCTTRGSGQGVTTSRSGVPSAPGSWDGAVPPALTGSFGILTHVLG
jgi:hypothetical protein